MKHPKPPRPPLGPSSSEGGSYPDPCLEVDGGTRRENNATSVCPVCGNVVWGEVPVKRSLWPFATDRGLYAHVTCLEHKLGRKLTPEDLPPHTRPVTTGLAYWYLVTELWEGKGDSWDDTGLLAIPTFITVMDAWTVGPYGLFRDLDSCYGSLYQDPQDVTFLSDGSGYKGRMRNHLHQSLVQDTHSYQITREWLAVALARAERDHQDFLRSEELDADVPHVISLQQEMRFHTEHSLPPGDMWVLMAYARNPGSLERSGLRESVRLSQDYSKLLRYHRIWDEARDALLVLGHTDKPSARRDIEFAGVRLRALKQTADLGNYLTPALKQEVLDAGYDLRDSPSGGSADEV